ncbi:Small glutamine-rich tetratricopeptide repeat-containing protein 2 [Sorochytrium milnesiophthora]
MDDKTKRLAFAIVEFLASTGSSGKLSDEEKESLEVATQCIQEVFKIDCSDDEQKAMFSTKPATLVSIFDVFLKTQSKKNATNAASGAGASKNASDADKKKAEEFKSQGNKKVAEKDYDEAVRLYSEAIALDAQNAVYYSNRAAAYSQKGNHADAIKDAKRASEIDPNFSKAFSRLGHAYYATGKFQEAHDAYAEGLRLDPGNATMKAALAQAKSKLPSVTEPDDDQAGDDDDDSKNDDGDDEDAPRGGAPGGMPDLGNLSGLLNNPALMNMAQQFMQNPQFAQMAQGMMGGGAGRGAGGGGGGGNPLAGLMNNPELMNMAQQAMSDPNTMASLQGMMGGRGGGGAGRGGRGRGGR